MTAVTYAIVFSGGIIDGFSADAVKTQLAQKLNIDAAKMASLFSGKPVVLKRTPDKAEAIKYATTLKQLGADISVRALQPAPSTDAPAAARPAPPASTGLSTTGLPSSGLAKTPAPRRPATPAPATVTAPTPPAATPSAPAPEPSGAQAATTGMSLAPNVGDLFEAPPAPAPVDVDISNIALAENDNSPLAPPREITPVDVDISSLSVSENDGSPLVEPKPEVPKVAAPDFSLDEPGAVLETLHNDIPEVHPDISGMSLAFPGTDLLNPDEVDQALPPPAPDTSKIHLKPTFD